MERITNERLKELASWSPGGRTDTLSGTRDEWKEMARELLAYRDSGVLEQVRKLKAYLLNARIDVATGTRRATTITTIDGGIKVADDLLAKLEAIEK